jgi:hypothetical protein
LRAEVDLNIFRILLYRKAAGQELRTIWNMLSTIHDSPDNLKANVMIAAHQLKEKGLDFPITTAK